MYWGVGTERVREAVQSTKERQQQTRGTNGGKALEDQRRQIQLPDLELNTTKEQGEGKDLTDGRMPGPTAADGKDKPRRKS